MIKCLLSLERYDIFSETTFFPIVLLSMLNEMFIYVSNWGL